MKVNASTLAIFFIAECYFECSTKGFISKINVTEIIEQLITNAPLLAYYSSMRSNSELFVEKEISLNPLTDMLILYLRVRSHAYAKNKQQEYKVDKDATRAKSLRKERKDKNPSLDYLHNI